MPLPNEEKYLDSLVELLGSDKKAVMLYVAFELGIVIFTIKDLTVADSILFGGGGASAGAASRVLLVAAFAFFLLAAVLHFLYYRRLHLNQVAVSKYFLSDSAQEAYNLVFDKKSGLWPKHGWKYIAGMCSLVAGVALYVAFLGVMLF